MACHPPVGRGRGSGARLSRALHSNTQEFGNGPCMGPGRVFHMLLALGGGPERGLQRGGAGRAVGSRAQSRPPWAPARQENRPRPTDPCPTPAPSSGAQLAPSGRQAQTQMPYLLPLPHSSSIRPEALTSAGLSPSTPRTGLHPREQRSRGNSHRHTQNLLFLDEFQPA